MSIVDSLRYRWRVWTRPRAHEAELSEEMEFHLGLETMQREHAARGAIGATEARDMARRRFGNRSYYREEARHAAGLGGVDTVVQDVRFALRTFRRAPTFTAVAVLTLAIGIGANTAIFSAVNALLLRPLPFAAPDRLMSISLTLPARAGRPAQSDALFSHPQFVVFRDGQTAFSDVSVWLPAQFTVSTPDEAVRESGELVDHRYFATLGVRPALGRTFTAADDRVGAARVAMISDDFWQRLFNRDSAVVGKTVNVDGFLYSIVGVLPPSFHGLSGQMALWMPILASPWPTSTIDSPGFHSYFAIGRLARGVTPDQAAALVPSLGARVDAVNPITEIPDTHWGVRATPLDATRLRGDDRGALLILFGAVGLVLLVACANVAGLFLARAASRRREIAVRLAIGAGRARLVRQLLVESLLLASFGGVASLVVASVGVRILAGVQANGLLADQAASGIQTGSLQAIQLDPRALVFAALVSIATGVLFGLAPALQSTRLSLSDALASESATSGRRARRRFNGRQMLTIVEIALAVVLLAGSGLLARSFADLVGVHPGFDADHVLTFRVNRAPDWSLDSIGRFYDVALARLAQIPGVADVAIEDCPPLAGGCSPQSGARLLDRPPGPAGDPPMFGIHWITPAWPRVMRVPLVRGRLFTTQDGPGAPNVMLINEAAARAYWPGRSPIGRALSFGKDTFYIVGVVGDVRYRSIDSLARPDVYVPYHQQHLSARMMFFIRTQGDPAAIAGAARQALKEVAPGFPVHAVATMESRVEGSVATARFSAMLLGLFASFALLLATIGAYGVVSFAVAQRRREIGVRVALGATGRDVVAMVVRQGMALAVIGGGIGLAAALVATRLLRTQLYGVEPADPLTLVGIVALLLLAVFAASWIPARRAAGLPPVDALRGS
jgi:putative ABC transport system permease protein